MPRHQVTLDGFWIDRTEVTHGQYRKCVAAEACDKPGRCSREESYYITKSVYPVACIGWNKAQAYCEWAGGRLPTEAEWEYAARGPESYLYPWGDEFDSALGNFDDEIVIDESVVPGGEGSDGYPTAAPVGSFPGGASWCGALDMAGNVWEWVADYYHSEYYEEAPTHNPAGPESPEFRMAQGRVCRGGSWLFGLKSGVRAANRQRPASSHVALGFRCVVASGD